MKYIRTKTAIYQKIGETKNCYIVKCKTKNKERLLSKSKIIAQANTIEELCDEFVGILPDEIPYLQFYRTIYNFNDIKTHYLNTLSVEPKTEYYGAIWSNKGFIYVAKMNDKGELELI